MSVDTYTMTPETFATLRAQADTIALQDREVGLMFQALVLHIGHAFGLDPVKEDARLAALALEASRKEEDDRLKADADALAAVRATEDAQTGLTPEQIAVRTAARTQEDAQIEAAAVALQEARDAEDAHIAGAPDAVAVPVVPPVTPAPDSSPIVAQAPSVQEG